MNNFFKIPFLLFITGLSVCSFSCKKKNYIPVVHVSPSNINISAMQGDVLTFKVYVSGDEEDLSRFAIHTQIENAVIKTELDTTISGKVLYYTYQYICPDTIEGSVFITFSAYDKDGEKGETGTRVIIAPESIILTETAGHIIYSKFSGSPDVFDIATGTVKFSGVAPLNVQDIADYDTIPSDSLLQKAWHSPAGNQFVAFSGFDYANATNLTAKAAYNAGIKLSFLSDVKSNDIFITKINHGAKDIYAVIRVTNVIDLPGLANDKYEFNLKK